MSSQWEEDALCGRDPDPDRWFRIGEGAKHEQIHIQLLRFECNRCPVQAECLAFALADPAGDWGVWAGTTPKQRADIKRKSAA